MSFQREKCLSARFRAKNRRLQGHHNLRTECPAESAGGVCLVCGMRQPLYPLLLLIKKAPASR